jgi:acetyl-CoA acetyltransferase
MAQRQRDNSWQRTREGLGLWEHRGKVACVGWGQSWIDRRWDGKTMDRTLGELCMQAIKKALADAGLGIDDIDGLMASPDTRAEQTWAPRPYFAPPYDTEDGLTYVSADWIKQQMGFKNATYLVNDAPQIGAELGMAVQAVGDGKAKYLIAWYPMCNLEGRYGHNNPQNVAPEARGNAAFSLPWGYQGGAMFNNLVIFQQYCKRYGKSHDGLMPLAINQRRNGLRTPWGFYTLHEPYQLTPEDYRNGRLVEEPLVVYDCDRPINTCAAYIYTTADRAKDLNQKPIYILNHVQNNVSGRSTMSTLDEQQEASAFLARKIFEGAGITVDDIDVFNPYDGYLTFTQNFLEGFGWHGVKKGEAHDFYAGDIRVEGPHPFCSSGGNNGTGRNRSSLHSDSLEQLRGTAGARQVTIKNGRPEIAAAGGNTPDGCGWLVYSTTPGT